MKFWSRNNLDKLDRLTPQDVYYPWSCPTTKQLLRLTALAKNMYKTARGVKTDTEIHLGRSKAIFLTLWYRRNRANYFDGPIKRSLFFVAEFRLLRSKKKIMRKYHVGWNIFKNSIWISYNSRVNFFNKVKAWNILREIRK